MLRRDPKISQRTPNFVPRTQNTPQSTSSMTVSAHMRHGMIGKPVSHAFPYFLSSTGPRSQARRLARSSSVPQQHLSLHLAPQGQPRCDFTFRGFLALLYFTHCAPRAGTLHVSCGTYPHPALHAHSHNPHGLAWAALHLRSAPLPHPIFQSSSGGAVVVVVVVVVVLVGRRMPRRHVISRLLLASR